MLRIDFQAILPKLYKFAEFSLIHKNKKNNQKYSPCDRDHIRPSMSEFARVQKRVQIIAIVDVEMDSPHLHDSASSQIRDCSRDALSGCSQELSNSPVCKHNGDEVGGISMAFLHVKQPRG
jgi:hypothetical protein